jgi:hypothetical protein
VVKILLDSFQVLFISAFDFGLSPSTARLHRGPGVVPPEGDLHWPLCFAVFSLKGERPKPNSRAQKKDHENEHEKYKIGTQEPTRTVEHWKQTKD